MVQKLLALTLIFLAAGLLQVCAQTAKPSAQTAGVQLSAAAQKYELEGVSVELSVAPSLSADAKHNALLAGTEARVRFRIADTNAGKAIRNLRPAAWIDRRDGGSATDARTCREKVQSFLQTGFTKRPALDLNVYFILALNQEPNISVIDPISGVAGSKLYTLIPLRGSGEDWIMSADQKRIYVSMPSANQVAVVDTATWKVSTNLDAGMTPERVALQHDGRYLWVANDSADAKQSGVTVIDTESLKVSAQLKTGAGHHEIAFADNDSLAFISNQQDGTVSVIDIRSLAVIRTIPVGPKPVSLVFSSLSQSVYVANEGDGTVASLNGRTSDIQARMSAQPGLGTLRISPDGRFGFVTNKSTNTIYIFDVSSNRIVHAVPVGAGADQISFTREFAYVRSVGNEFVSMIKLTDLGKEAAVNRFPAGQKAPQDARTTTLADAITRAPEPGAVLVANPADKMIYFYSEGMAAPMGSFQNYGRAPKALLVQDNSLRESAPGEYTTTVRLGGAGQYDVAFLLDAPRMVNCFSLDVAENPSLPKPNITAIRIEPVEGQAPLHVGENYRLRFKVISTTSQQARLNLADVGVLVFLAPGIWQQRMWATGAADGTYEVSFTPPQAGAYYVYFHCPSLNVQSNEITPMTLRAVK